MKTIDLFGEKPRQPRRIKAHVIDAFSDGPGEQYIRYACAKCGYETEWTTAPNVTTAKQGVPCPKCNK